MLTKVAIALTSVVLLESCFLVLNPFFLFFYYFKISVFVHPDEVHHLHRKALSIIEIELSHCYLPLHS